MQEIEKLLQEVSRLSEEFYAAHEKKGMIERFNVFEILGVETDEKKICRFLCEILSPSKALRNGFLSREFFLKSFVKKVLGLNIPDDKLEKAEVCREYTTENGRRIDIVIRSKGLFIPIEVKIWAWDLNEQCKDYYDEAKKYDADAKIFYLTPNGKSPSPESSNGVPSESMKCISFENDIYDWISYCIGQPEVIRNEPLREVLLQFAATVKNLTQQTMEEQLKMEIAELIRKSPENLRVATSISSSLGTALESLLLDFLKTVEKHMIERGKESEYSDSNLYYGAYNHRSVNFFAGLFYPQNNNMTKPGARLDIEIGIAYIGKFNPATGKWGDFHKCVLKNGKVPNFKYPNEALYELCDEKAMEDFARKCADEIESCLDELKQSNA